MGGDRELGVRLKRDASMISKPYSKYTEQRDLGAEGRIRRLLNNKSINDSGLTPCSRRPLIARLHPRAACPSTASPGTHTRNVAKTV